MVNKKDILIDRIKHNDLQYYCTEGYGGKSLEHWPVTAFYRAYSSGDTQAAIKDYAEWYIDQLSKYATKEKKFGGMKNGSLFQIIEKRTGKKFNDTTTEEKWRVVTERVIERFALLESLTSEGYQETKAERIYAVKKKNFFYLKGGHHRAAALLVLGYEDVPGVIVFPNQLVYNVFSVIRKIKKYAKI